ncbi:MAG TPA: right-handed parallel beta-helix repeat-containing protein, partial [Verrucomicrobiae bacterium]|nr:right-handed parallel beta-helix repeat-containing protein [Verrucomicrobiae bacterium]
MSSIEGAGQWFISVLLFCSCGLANAATYDVGDGHPQATPSDVPWEALNAGDVVNIYWRATPYKNKWVINRQGTENEPIIVRGIPGPTGERPVIDGNGATTRLALNYWSETRGVIKVGGASIPSDDGAGHVLIENLEVRSGRPPYHFTDDSGSVQSYPNNAAAIFVEKGHHITIRNCALHDSGNGLFVSHESSDVLVDGNYIYDNGNVGSLYEHNSYTAAAGITFQFNHYGPLREGCLGNNLKDRSAGLVVR